ncbi:MAG: HU family DNA-binding protein [Mailhella sp.]|nr:HU family DNA-binding protein [Mailhella sp.]
MFWTEKKDEHQGRDPRTGEAITVPARTAIKFKAYSQLKNRLQ